MTGLDILDQLASEHEQLKDMFVKAQNCKLNERSKYLNEIKKELIPHSRGEEKTIYALLRGILNTEKSSREEMNLTNEAYEEHRLIDELFADLEATATNDLRWIAHLKVIKENLAHHIKEEENELFQIIRKYFSEERLRELRTVYLSVRATYVHALPSQAQINEKKPSQEIISI